MQADFLHFRTNKERKMQKERNRRMGRIKNKTKMNQAIR
jgi:hypothetical protein